MEIKLYFLIVNNTHNTYKNLWRVLLNLGPFQLRSSLRQTSTSGEKAVSLDE